MDSTEGTKQNIKAQTNVSGEIEEKIPQNCFNNNKNKNKQQKNKTNSLLLNQHFIKNIEKERENKQKQNLTMNKTINQKQRSNDILKKNQFLQITQKEISFEDLFHRIDEEDTGDIDQSFCKNLNNYKFDYYQQNNPIFSEPCPVQSFQLFQDILVPNPQCLECVQFFYSHISYNFSLTNQIHFIIDTQQSYKKDRLKKAIECLVKQQQQCFLFITDYKQIMSQTYIYGFRETNKFQFFKKFLIQKIKHLSYQKGQVYFTLNDFDIKLIPIFNHKLKDLNEENVKEYYSGKYAIRVKYSPSKNKPLVQNKIKIKEKEQVNLNNEKQSQKDEFFKNQINKCNLNTHFPLNCLESINYSFLPSIKTNKLQIRSLIEQQKTKSFRYKKSTIIQISNSRKSYINQLRNKLNSQKITHNIFQPFVQFRNISSQNSKCLWVISHDCSHSIIKNLIKIIKNLGDIKIHRTSKNLVIKDEDFFYKQTFDNFRKVYDNLTSSSYIIYNQKNQMKFISDLLPIYLSFQHQTLAILAMCIFLDLNIRKILLIKLSQLPKQNLEFFNKNVREVESQSIIQDDN